MQLQFETVQTCNVCRAEAIEVLDPIANICRCKKCGFVFDSPRPTEDELVAFYSKPAKYDSWLNETQARDSLWKNRLRRILAKRKQGSLLDVGTGIGQFLAHARPYFTEVHGTEVSSSAISIARERYGLELCQGTMNEIDFRGRTFDNVTLFHVLEHVTDPAALLRKCRAVLAPGGIMVVAVPNDLRALRTRLRQVRSKLRKHGNGSIGLPRITLDGSLDEIHLSHFTQDVLEKLMRQCGFDILETGLDRYYVATGTRKLKEDNYYALCSTMHRLFRINVYDTILVIARKPSR